MGNLLKPGDVVGERFRIERLMGRGGFGDVYQATDQVSRRYVLKIISKDRSRTFLEYADYLLRMKELLSGASAPNLLLPVDAGQTSDFFYVAFDFVEMVEGLNSVIARDAPLQPLEALTIVAEVGRGLAYLHARSLVHADVKPANILVSESSPAQVYLTDLGMARPIGADGEVLIVGSYGYMHPELIGGYRRALGSAAIGAEPCGPISPQIDIYALGVVAVEMLTGEADIPQPLSELRIAATLEAKNPWVRSLDRGVVDQMVNLLCRMLSVHPPQNSISAQDVYSISSQLVNRLRGSYVAVGKTGMASAAAVLRPIDASDRALAEVVQRLESITDSLRKSTSLLLSTDKTLETAASPQVDDQTLREISTVFANAIGRSRNSWRLAVAMTVMTFAVLVAMMVAALTTAVITGRSGWALIFGGASVSLILGTLVWRPFDRLFRAAILAQQLEMIHVQTVAAFRATVDVDRRMHVCKEAIAALEAMFEHHATPEPPPPAIKGE